MHKRRKLAARAASFMMSAALAVSVSGCGGQNANRGETGAAAPQSEEMFDSARQIGGPAEYQLTEGELSAEEYSAIKESGFVSPAQHPLSTFATSVDTASYSLVRAKGRLGQPISPDMVRLEEFVNYFPYSYAPPKEGPLSISTEMGPCAWNKGHQLLLVGLKAKEVSRGSQPPSNLVFLIDTSGSMDSADKLGLVKKAFTLLTENLRPEDRVSIVVYAGSQETLLDGASAKNAAAIRECIESLAPYGSTNGAGGIEAAYALAEKNYIKGGTNRVLLATDGDFNVGVSSEGDLSRLIAQKRKTGVFLSVLGFGMGNYKDNKMEALARDGNGNAYYIDSELEARKVLAEQLGATLNTVAKDAKIQLEFNPAYVKGYRLLGYENRMLQDEDFENDSVDAGEIGSGHCVTALYEIIAAGSGEEVPSSSLKYQEARTVSSSELATVSLRYKEPDGAESKLASSAVLPMAPGEANSDNFRWASACAQAALLLRRSENAAQASWDSVLELASPLSGLDAYRADFIEFANSVKGEAL